MALRLFGAISSFILAIAQHEIEEENRGDVYRVKELTNWADDDPVEVYYAEFLLAQWVLDRSPWNAYHSGLAFVNNRTDQKVIYDYTPDDTSSVMNMIIPTVESNNGLLAAALLGEVNFTWRDSARMKFIKHWPDKYSNIVRLGRLNGKVFNIFADWVVSDYLVTHTAFQPIEVARVSASGLESTILRSRMCHDFVTDALWILYDNGVKMRAATPIFRDHIIMYGSHIEPASELVETRHGKRKWLRYLRTLHLFLAQIKEQFTYARVALIVAWKLGIPAYIHDQHRMQIVRLAPPFLNYCYLPLAIPPQKHHVFGANKLCALGLEANVSNVTAPWPLGPLMSVEEQIDSPQNIAALVFVALCALLAGGSSDKA